MKKDAYFFPHYCNARHDRKLKRVIKELGVEGYGIYFMLLEVLREQIDFKYPLEDLDLLADEFGTSEQKLRTVIANYKLFDVDEEQRFFSIKLVFYLQPYIEKSQRARDAANIRWEQSKLQLTDANAYANALQIECPSNADAMQGEESKVNKTKEELKREKKSYSENPDLNKAILDFIAFRKSIKKPMSDHAVELFIEKLGKMSVNPSEQIEIINQSILNGWSSVYEIKADKTKPNNKKQYTVEKQTKYTEEELEQMLLKKGAK